MKPGCGKVNHSSRTLGCERFSTKGHGLTASAVSLYFPLLYSNFHALPGDADEAHVPSAESQADQQARFPRPHEDQERSQGSQRPTPSGSLAAHREGGQQVGPVGSERPDVHQGATSGFGLPRADRIRQRDEIRTLLDRGKRKKTKVLDVFFMPSPVARPRFGVIVPKHRHRIVDRNRVRRRLKEIGRQEVLSLLRERRCAVDVLVRARREAYSTGYDELKTQLVRVVEGICSGES